MDIYAAGVISSRATLTERNWTQTVLMNFIRVISDSVVENDFSYQYVIYGQPIMRPQQPINALRIGCNIPRLVEELQKCHACFYNFTLAASWVNISSEGWNLQSLVQSCVQWRAGELALLFITRLHLQADAPCILNRLASLCALH